MTSKLSKIHPTAVVDKKAKLGSGVVIGPYCVIGPQVTLGKDTRLANHVTVMGQTQIGERCVIFTGACLGVAPQMRKKNFKETALIVGDDNEIREYVTMATGIVEGSTTRVGNRNYLMTGVHIAHDCQLGDEITIANGTVFGGHCEIEDQATLSGVVAVHQFTRIGRLSMVGGLSKVVTDVPPYSICDGHPARFYGVNSVGLKRAGLSSKDALILRKVFRALLTPGNHLETESANLQKEFKGHTPTQHVLDFLKQSKRGFCRVEE